MVNSYRIRYQEKNLREIRTKLYLNKNIYLRLWINLDYLLLLLLLLIWLFFKLMISFNFMICFVKILISSKRLVVVLLFFVHFIFRRVHLLHFVDMLSSNFTHLNLRLAQYKQLFFCVYFNFFFFIAKIKKISWKFLKWDVVFISLFINKFSVMYKLL